MYADLVELSYMVAYYWIEEHTYGTCVYTEVSLLTLHLTGDMTAYQWAKSVRTIHAQTQNDNPDDLFQPI